MINWLIKKLVFLNNLGFWEMMNFFIVIAGVVFGSFYFFRKRRVPMLNIFTSHSKRQGVNYTSLINVEFRNFTGCGIAICNPYFKYRDLKPDPVAHRDSYSGEAEVKFRGVDGNVLTEIETFLRHKESTATWIPVDPTHSNEEVKSALNSKRVGILYFTCVWITKKPKVRNLAIHI